MEAGYFIMTWLFLGILGVFVMGMGYLCCTSPIAGFICVLSLVFMFITCGDVQKELEEKERKR